jgi:hypothetical protein
MADVTAAFKTNPTTFLATHATLFKGFPGSFWQVQTGTKGVFKKKPVYETRWAYNWKTEKGFHGALQFYMPAVAYKSLDIQVEDKAGTVCEITVVKAAPPADGVVFLPWTEDTATSILLSNQAKYFFTGPLDACHVYIARDHHGNLLAMHVNSNKNKGDKAANARAKSGMADETLRNLSAGFRIVKSLTDTDYKPTDGSPCNAFVMGINTGGTWDFYVHSVKMPALTIEHAAKAL